ncbi:MAG: HAD family hydrolase [Slackia sp.]|nr:HAD family hydrolase [Slackia sp.]
MTTRPLNQSGKFFLARFSNSSIKPSAPEYVEGVIFDLDGTLIDSMPWWENLGENYLIARGKTPAPDIRRHFKRMTLEQSAVLLRENYDLEESVEEICRGILDGIEHAYRDSIPLKPGVGEMLDAMADAGVRMCVATATERHCAEAALGRLGIRDAFSAVLTCSEAGASKTEPAVFEAALSHLGTQRNKTLVMEDSLHAIETAHAAGFPVAGVFERSAAPEANAILTRSDIYLHSFALAEARA